MLLVLVFVPEIGRSAGGARRWLDLGICNIQPSEIAKLAILLFIADFIALSATSNSLKTKVKLTREKMRTAIPQIERYREKFLTYEKDKQLLNYVHIRQLMLAGAFG